MEWCPVREKRSVAHLHSTKSGSCGEPKHTQKSLQGVTSQQQLYQKPIPTHERQTDTSMEHHAPLLETSRWALPHRAYVDSRLAADITQPHNND